MHLRSREHLAAGLIGLAAAVVAVALTWPGSQLGLLSQIFWRLELASYDFRLANSAPNTPSEEIALVTIDELSIAHLGVWPWPRSYHARAIETLAKAGAKVIGLDVSFTTVSGSEGGEQAAGQHALDWEPPPSKDDLALEDALKAAGNVVLPVVLAEREAEYGDREVRLTQAEFPYWRFEEAAYAVAAGSMPKDLDGSVRRSFLEQTYQDEGFYTMPVLLAAAHQRIEPDALVAKIAAAANIRHPALRGDSFLIAYRGNSDTGFRQVPFYKILWKQFSPADVRGKTVLIGATAPTLQDLYDTPMTLGLRAGEEHRAGRQMPGVEVIASALDTILGGRYLRPVDLLPTLLLTCLLALIVSLGTVRLRPFWALLVVWPPVQVATLLLAFAFFESYRLWLLLVPPVLGTTLSYASATVYLEMTTEAQRRRLQQSWARRVSPEVLEVILSTPGLVQVAGRRVVATVLFADLRGFTTFCHESAPEQVVATLNQCLALITRIIRRHGGTVHKFIGDGVMAVFGDPVPQPDHARRAVLAARDMQQSMAQLRMSMEGADWVPYMRVGIHTGELVAGDIGSEDLSEYTVIGDTVSTASRLEALNKEYGTEIMISKSTQMEAGAGFHLQPIGLVEIRGRAEPLEVFAVSPW